MRCSIKPFTYIPFFVLLAVASLMRLGPTPAYAADDAIQMPVVNVASNDVLHIREQPSSESRIVGIIPPHARGIKFLGLEVDQWTFVRFDNTQGWVSSRFVVPEVAGWVGRGAMEAPLNRDSEHGLLVQICSPLPVYLDGRVVPEKQPGLLRRE